MYALSTPMVDVPPPRGEDNSSLLNEMEQMVVLFLYNP